DAGGNFGPDARRACHHGLVLQRHGIGEVGGIERAKHRERHVGADALHRLQRPEPGALMLGGKAIQPDRILAHMRVDGERHDLPNPRQALERPRGAGHLIADAVHIDDQGRRPDLIEAPGELADHGAPLAAAATAASNRLQERQWAWVMAMASASAASALSGAARGRSRATIDLICTLSPWPAPTTVFLTAFSAYLAIETPRSAGTSMAMPRAWPSFNVAEASRLTKVCWMAASTGARRGQ